MDEIKLIDSNVLVYAFDASEAKKHAKAKKIVKACLEGERYAVSVQNLSEWYVNVTGKIERPITAAEASQVLKRLLVFDRLAKLPIVPESLMHAADIAQNFKVSFWDALIASVMLQNGISEILTEDVRGFSKIQGIRATDPFA